MNLHRLNLPLSWGWRCLIGSALVAAGLAGNYFHFLIFLDVDFLFGSIFAMLALQVFGVAWGTLAAALIASYTYLLWNQPYAMLIMTLEVALVGVLLSRKAVGLVLADTLYWLLIGMPLGYFFYHQVIAVDLSGTAIIITKQAINGISNALLARLIFSGLSLRLGWQLRSLRELFANLLSFFVLLPMLLMLGLASRMDFAEADSHLRSGLRMHSQNATRLLQLWLQDRTNAVLNLTALAASLSPAQMQERLQQTKQADHNFLRIGMRDTESMVLAYAPALDEYGNSNVGKRFLERPYIAELKKNLRPMLAEVVMARIDRTEPVANLLAPVLKQGHYHGYVNAVLQLDELREMLARSLENSDSRYTVLDRRGQVILSNRPELKMMTTFSRSGGTLTAAGADLHQWVPALPSNTAAIERWRNSVYVAQTALGSAGEWQLVMEQPVAPVQTWLYQRYSKALLLTFLALLLALAMAEYLGHRLMLSLSALGDLTRHLPQRLTNSSLRLAWPRTGMTETQQLIDNFSDMASTLLEAHDRQRQLSDSLERKVNERTHALQQSELALKRTLQEQKAVLENDLVGIVRVRDRHILWANPAFETMLGYRPGELADTPTRQNYRNEAAWLEFGQAAYPVLARGGIYRAQIEHVRKDGKAIWVDMSGAMLNADTGESLWAFLDITEHKLLEDKVQQLAFHDTLTQLPNRQLLTNRLEQAMLASKRSGLYGAVLFVDLDNFKPLNDRHGHEMGDLLLVEVARRLRACLREDDSVARLGGDEFVVLLTGLNASRIDAVKLAASIAEKIRLSLSQPYQFNPSGNTAKTVRHVCSASIGIAVFVGNAAKQDALLRQADAAMYRAKAEGRNRVHFDGTSA